MPASITSSSTTILEAPMPEGSRKMIDCRRMPSERNCSITISGTEDEVLTIATRHAVEEHGHADTPELREQLRGALIDEPSEIHA
jgi:hypothetical protein